jgi:high-affinity Fe2+/Pb2+ permease
MEKIVKRACVVLMGLVVSSGVGAVILMGLNMLIWTILTLWVGSALAFIGFFLIMFALRPKRDAEELDAETAHSLPEGQPVRA